MATQRCPACGTLHDVSIFVSGKKVKCSSCGLHFVVQRPESMIAPAGAEVSQAGGNQAVKPPEQPEAKERKPRAADAIPKAPPSDGDTTPGTEGLEIAGFEIHEMLGKGGMGRVYRARQVSLNRWVAIKILNEDLAKHHSFIRRFEKESGALAALNHPNITLIIDRGHNKDTYYFIMEYVDGKSLRQKINARPDLEEIIDLAIVLCDAVDHAHKRSVIHRDLKPENVLFTTDGLLKVADFGLANIVGPDRRWELTRTQVSMGTVNYMAPEQRRDAKHVDHRADIYSLGVILYEMLVGELPLGRFDPPSKKRKDVDSRTDQLVLKMLDFDPDRRPQQAGLVAATLRSIYNRKATRQTGDDRKKQAGVKVDSREDTHESPLLPTPEPVEPGSVMSGAGEQKTPRSARRKHGKGLSSLLLWSIGALFLILAGVAIVVTVLLHSGLEDEPGDMLVQVEGEDFSVKVVHPREVAYLSPATVERRGDETATRFDFMPSTKPVEPVTFIGGDWEAERGRLVQDSCRDKFVINQVPARALFGEATVPEGMLLSITLSAQRSTYRKPGGGELKMEQFLENAVGGVRVLLPLGVEYRAGLGFMDADGTGLEVLLPLGDGKQGQLVRHGVGMEGKDSEFAIEKGLLSGQDQDLKLQLSFAQGRVKMKAQDVELLDELAGFPLKFRGSPSVACQNMRCVLSVVEYSVR